MLTLSPDAISAIDRALAEDQAHRDATVAALIDPAATTSARFTCKADGVIAGLSVAAAVFQRIQCDAQFESLVDDGQAVSAGDVIAIASGRASALLRGERTALNFLQRMSGIATNTARYVAAVAHTNATILDTRKTAPGLRELDKYAVRIGGARNHRMNLADGILIKDTHFDFLQQSGASLADVIRWARRNAPHTLRVQVEISDINRLEEALDAGAELILLDNMTPSQLAEAACIVNGRALLEASGGVTLDNVAAIADTGVDFISVGALTHSVTALDISMTIGD